MAIFALSLIRLREKAAISQWVPGPLRQAILSFLPMDDVAFVSQSSLYFKSSPT